LLSSSHGGRQNTQASFSNKSPTKSIHINNNTNIYINNSALLQGGPSGPHVANNQVVRGGTNNSTLKNQSTHKLQKKKTTSNQS